MMLFSLFTGIIWIENVNADVIYVDDDGAGYYKTIQDAIDEADPGDTIFVYSGIYYENLVIDKSITLQGQDKNTTIIGGNGGKDDITVYVSAGGVTITNFKIQDDSYYQTGIQLDHIQDCFIENIIIKDCDFGMHLYSSDNNNILKNDIINSKWAGILLDDASGNIVTNNNVFNNNGNGIHLTSSGNNFCTNNLIYLNNFYNNGDNAIYTYPPDFFNNYDDAYNYCNNDWDNGEVGNYWDDYTGIDTNNDGMGDSPYDITGGGIQLHVYNQDFYPLMEPWSTRNAPTADAGDDITAHVGNSVSFQGSTSEGKEIDLYEWDFDGDGNFDWSSQTTSDTSNVYFKINDYSATFRVIYEDGSVETDTRKVTINPYTYETNKAIITYFGDSGQDLPQPRVEEGLDYLRSAFESIVAKLLGIPKIISFPFSIITSLLIDYNVLLASEYIEIKAIYDDNLLDNVVIEEDESVFLLIIFDDGPSQDDILIETKIVTDILNVNAVSTDIIPTFGDDGFIKGEGRYIIIPKEPFKQSDAGDYFVEVKYGAATSEVRLEVDEAEPDIPSIPGTSTPGFELLIVIFAVALILFLKRKENKII